MVANLADFPIRRIEEKCRKYQVRELALFGSALRDDFRADSDIDLLVDFQPHHTIGLIAYYQCQQELAAALGRPVDLVQKSGLKPFLREQILSSARVLYAD